jgi:hypothetical protein
VARRSVGGNTLGAALAEELALPWTLMVSCRSQSEIMLNGIMDAELIHSTSGDEKVRTKAVQQRAEAERTVIFLGDTRGRRG